MYKISIALCTYNGEEYLAEQLESYSRQTRQPDQLIVCDDASSDDTVKILEEFAGRVSFEVKIFVNENKLGYIKNFEKAITLSAGDLIFLSDQDDVWHADKLEIFERKFDEDAAVGLVFCNANLVDEKLEPLGKDVRAWLGLSPQIERLFKEGKVLPKLFNQNYSPGFTMAFRAKYKNLILPLPSDVYLVVYDYWIALLLTAVSKVVPLAAPLVDYRQHSKQNVGASPAFSQAVQGLSEKNDYRRNFEGLKALRERLEQHEDEYDVRNALAETDECLKHSQVRNDLQNGALAQIPNLFRDLFARRYHRYSSGFKSASKDLFLSLSSLKGSRKN